MGHRMTRFVICLVVLLTIHSNTFAQTDSDDDCIWCRAMSLLEEEPRLILESDMTIWVKSADLNHLSLMTTMINSLPESIFSEEAVVSAYVKFVVCIIEEYCEKLDVLNRLADSRKMFDLLADYKKFPGDPYFNQQMLSDPFSFQRLNYLRYIATMIQGIYQVTQSDIYCQEINYGSLHYLENILWGYDKVTAAADPYYYDVLQRLCNVWGIDYDPQIAFDQVMKYLYKCAYNDEYDAFDSSFRDIMRMFVCAPTTYREEIMTMLQTYVMQRGLWNEFLVELNICTREYFPIELCNQLVPLFSLRIRMLKEMQDLSVYMQEEYDKGKEYLGYLPWSCPEELKTEGFDEYDQRFLGFCRFMLRCFVYDFGSAATSYKFNLFAQIYNMFGVSSLPELLSTVGGYAIDSWHKGSYDALTVIEDILRLVSGGVACSPVVVAEIAGIYTDINHLKTEIVIDNVLLDSIKSIDRWMGGQNDLQRVATMCITAYCASKVNKSKYSDEITSIINELNEILPQLEETDRTFFQQTLSSIYIELGEYVQAANITDSLKGRLSDEDMEHQKAVEFMALSSMGNYRDAFNVFKSTDLEVYDSASLLEAIRCASAYGEFKKAKELCDFYVMKRAMTTMSSIMFTPEDNEAFGLCVRKRDLPGLTSLMTHVPESEKWRQLNAGLLYDWNLITKGMTLKSRTVFHKYMLDASHEEFKNAYGLFNKFSRESDYDEGNRSNIEYASLLSYEFADMVRGDSSFVTSQQQVLWTDVQDALKKDEYAIEYTCLGDEYYASLIGKTLKAPIYVKLCNVGDIRQASADCFDDRLYKSPEKLNKLYHLFWEPLTRYIKAGNTVYYSTDGILNHINLDLLCDNDMDPVCDTYCMVRVSTTGQLPEKKGINDISNAVFYGDLNYHMNVSEISAESGKYIYNALEAHDRGAVSDFVVPREDLPETRDEVYTAAEILKSAGKNPIIMDKNLGTEYSFKMFSGKNIDLLHLATHGFWWGTETDASGNYISPMKRSGIVLSGVNDGTVKDDSAGVLFADEVAELDLSSVELLILSACQTADGEIRDDGVFGIQRGFKQAGVRTIVMTLWPVNSLMTTDLITRFYYNLANGMDKHSAFVEARRAISMSYPSTKDWAAFIMLD